MADRWYELGTQALHAAMRDPHDLAGAAPHVQALFDECGQDGLVRAILGWSDTLINRSGIPTDGTPVRAAWMPYDPDDPNPQVKTADEIEPVARWAGRLLVARAALDQDAWNALMDSVPKDPAVMGDHVMELLGMIALNLRMIQDGTHPTAVSHG